MQKLFSITTVLMLLSQLENITLAQNLVPNPSFEDIVACPNLQNQVEKANGWINFRRTPDYFNSCDTTPIGSCGGVPYVGVPKSCFGYQCPANGNAYFGLYSWGGGGSNYREFFGCQLLSPLIIGQKYFVSFKIVLAEPSSCATNKLGCLFATYTPSSDTFGTAPLNNFAHIYTNAIITDTADWVTVSTSFVADSNYSFALFGNFYDDQNTDTANLGGGVLAYYFMDDICVSSDSQSCVIPNGNNVCNTGTEIKEKNFKETFFIFPNPTKEKLSIEANQPFYYSIYNLLGVKLLSSNVNFSSKFEIDVNQLSAGMYFLNVKTKLNTINQFFFIMN